MAKDTTEATKQRQRNAELKKKFGEFLKEGQDPEKLYGQWCKAIFGETTPDDALLHFALSQAKAAGIDPTVPRQIYVKDGKVIIAIEGLVTIAENTGNYGGTTRPEFEMSDDGNTIISCAIGVQKVVKGNVITSWQEVDFKEYATEDTFWKEKPKTMIKKVALAHALRAAFSACAGMYIAEEVAKGGGMAAPAGTPDVLSEIENAKSRKDLQKIIKSLSVAEQKRVAPVIAERMKELK